MWSFNLHDWTVTLLWCQRSQWPFWVIQQKIYCDNDSILYIYICSNFLPVHSQSVCATLNIQCFIQKSIFLFLLSSFFFFFTEFAFDINIWYKIELGVPVFEWVHPSPPGVCGVCGVCASRLPGAEEQGRAVSSGESSQQRRLEQVPHGHKGENLQRGRLVSALK